MVTNKWAILFFCGMKKKKKAATKKSPAKKKDAVKKVTTNSDILKVARRIRQLRIAQGFTSYEYFAYEHEISRSQMGRYEKGEDLRISSLLRVIRAFGITPEQFFSKGFK